MAFPALWQHYSARSKFGSCVFNGTFYRFLKNDFVLITKYFEQIEDARRRPTNTMLLVLVGLHGSFLFSNIIIDIN